MNGLEKKNSITSTSTTTISLDKDQTPDYNDIIPDLDLIMDDHDDDSPDLKILYRIEEMRKKAIKDMYLLSVALSPSMDYNDLLQYVKDFEVLVAKKYQQWPDMYNSIIYQRKQAMIIYTSTIESLRLKNLILQDENTKLKREIALASSMPPPEPRPRKKKEKIAINK